MGFWRAGDVREAGADWCMGFWHAGAAPGARDGAVGGARGGDRALPGCEGSGHGAAAHLILRSGDAGGGTGRRHQLGRVAVQAGEEGRGRMVLVARRGHGDADAAQQGETVAVEGTCLGVVAAVDGAGGAQAGEAVGRAGAGAAAAVHAAATVASDGGGSAGAARAGAGAAAEGEVEGGIASGGFLGWGSGGGEGGHCGRS
jgi:hypothetical protein